jgi:hypothetical protein
VEDEEDGLVSDVSLAAFCAQEIWILTNTFSWDDESSRQIATKAFEEN